MEEIRAIDFVLAFLTEYKEQCCKNTTLYNPIIYFDDINKFIEAFKKKYGNYDIDLTQKDWETAKYYFKGKISFSGGDYYSVQTWFTKEELEQLRHNLTYSEKHDKIIEVWKTIKK